MITYTKVQGADFNNFSLLHSQANCKRSWNKVCHLARLNFKPVAKQLSCKIRTLARMHNVKRYFRLCRSTGRFISVRQVYFLAYAVSWAC